MHFRLILGLVFTVFSIALAVCQKGPLKDEKWTSYFANVVYEDIASQLTEENFWDYDRKHTYYTSYPLFIIYEDGSSEEIHWQYDGLPNLFRKKHTLIDDQMQRIEKGSIAYMVFDQMLLKNSMPENMLEGDFVVVHRKGPLTVYKEFYVPEADKQALQTFWSVYLLGEKVENLYLGRFNKKFSKLLESYPALSGKINDRILGYANKDDLPNIASEFNHWVGENHPYRYADHVTMFWQTPSYLSQD